MNTRNDDAVILVLINIMMNQAYKLYFITGEHIMLAKTSHCLAEKAKQPLQTSLLALVIAMSNVGVVEPVHAAQNLSPVGQGFTVTAADLAYILKQIKIAETHVAAGLSPDPADPANCQALVGLGPNKIPSPLLSFGLRTVDGQCNNLQPTQGKFGAADQVFPRLTVPNFDKQVEDAGDFGPLGFGLTNYNQTSGSVVDSQPRMISNLIVDQTSTNPAAAYVYLNPARAQGGAPIVEPCVSLGTPVGCEPVPEFETLFIPNVTTDVGLSPPFNSLFTIFGQFFDHGLDKITNGGNGAVFVPLKDGDPLIAGPDHILDDVPPSNPEVKCTSANVPDGCDETADNLPADKRFMVLTRGTVVNPDPSCVDLTNPSCYRSAPNTDTPFVDQSQTYTSHSSHQVFLREYDDSTGRPLATGKFLSTGDGGMATWAQIKDQAATKLGLQLVDVDVNNIPMVAADYYGNFIPGPARGLPQFVTASGLVEGCRTSDAPTCPGPVVTPANVDRIATAFLNDIAHSAGPGSISSPKLADDDAVAGGSLDTPIPAGSYDDELLNLHYICGDGRCNENIALTAVHQIFHMEHDRLVDDISATLNDPANSSLLADYQNLVAPLTPGAFKYEERLFQAARFVTEMEYQHLVFEEFARKVQPAINPFEPFAFNQTGADPAITAEFAHAVYRFGHSMLNDTVPRINDDLSDNSIPLLGGFLNPAEFNNGGTAGSLTDRAATGAIIMGLSDQVGNEIDEFVADTLRNNLLGLPLDLPSLNMTRARSEGVPSLNNVRKQIFAATNDAQLAPYANWIDFEQNIKHPRSLVNFIAAYGKHPAILAATTMADKRAVAQAIINGGLGAPAGSTNFMFSISPAGCVPTPATRTCWADIAGVSQTGLDDVDLWMGGLAEMTNLFGGLLGSTFNYVFEKQMTDLQNNDRLYYLARTPGMNLRTALEGNSFAELVMRNTNPYTHTLKADPFATADCKFELANLDATVDGFNTFGQTVVDDPTTECDETELLIRMPDGTIKYRASNSVDPAGINGQAVYNGTDLADFIYGGNDNDTFWGGLGDDTINGGGGDDVALGGDGDDIITDFAGADVLKGGPGNDAIDGGPGDDILMPGFGKDFTNGGQNTNETFASEGDDFVIAGKGLDAVFGDGGDDWEEGDDAPDLLIGDNSSLFFDDLNVPGHDVLIGQGGDDDYDMEGGDDIGVSGPGVEKIAGAAGYDWEIGLGDPQPQVMDLAIPLLGVPLPINAVRDKFNEVEALSGWKFNDTLYGDSVIPSQVGGAVAGGFIGCDALDADGVARIAGLELLVTPAMRTEDPATIALSAVTNYCGLTAEPGFLVAGDLGGVWGQGNILLGGAGSDTIEGRGANDVIDGDKYLNVRLSVRSGGEALDSDGVDVVTDGSGVEIGSTDLMVNKDNTARSFGPGAAGMTLQQAVFARKVNPGNIVTVREIVRPAIVTPDCNVTPANRVNCDKAVYSGPEDEYTVTARADGSVIVTDNADPAAPAPITPAVPRNTDGIDILWNMEQLSFCPVPGALPGTCNTIVAQGGAARTTVTITPTAAVRTSSFVFGNQAVGTTVSRTITIGNNGVANLIIPPTNLGNPSDPNNGVRLTGDASFTVTGGTCLAGANIAKTTGSCSIMANFTPSSADLKTANVVIAHNGVGVGSVTPIPVTGTGAVPIAAVSASSVTFPNTNVNVAQSASVTLFNQGLVNLTISTTPVTFNALTGAGFSRATGGCGATLAPGASCLINLRFRPTLGGNGKIGNLRINSNNGGGAGTPIDVVLSGNATIVANADQPIATVTSNTNAAVQLTPAFAVRANDVPANGSVSTVSIVGAVTITNPTSGGGATAVAEAVTSTGLTTPPPLTHVRFRLTPAGATATDRQNSKKATYTVTYRLTNGDATADATYTLTVN